MDDKRNKTLFRGIQEDCLWRKLQHVPRMMACKATGDKCLQINCAPFKMCLYFNRPEIKNQ